MIGFYTKFTTEERNRDALIAILSEAANSMQSSDDCKTYLVNKDVSDATATWVTEIWTTKEAHAASLQLEGAKVLISKAIPLITAKPEQIEIMPVAGKGL